ncbi:MAG: NAD(P)-dependent alcohol dehydrogenase [Planctomycetes bacterium]|nr:NAD(P)-dependent alcohol dehydrogenase [Planctomycetota bacterium]
MPIRAYAAASATAPLAPITIERREPRPTDVELDILWAGICHSDLHFARSEWEPPTYPVVPGHEIVGRVRRVGSRVTRFRVGELAAVGVLVDSCRTCAPCRRGEEPFCSTGPTFTYGSEDRISGGQTCGGYSERITCDEAFTLRLPATLDPARAAPLLCAGITTWSPLKRWQAGPGKKVGIVGLGGLGHMGVQFAGALGAETVVLTTSPAKAADAERLGASGALLTTDLAAMARHADSFDLIVDTVSGDHDLNALLALLRLDGALVLVGLPPKPQAVKAFSLVAPRRILTGSMIGGLAETQSMLDFCGQRAIACHVETVRVQQLNAAWERLARGDVKYRFVIDMASIRG